MKYLIISSLFLALFSVNSTAGTQTCCDNAEIIIQQMQSSDEFASMTEREKLIARHAAIAACDETFAKLETDLQTAKTQTEQGTDPSEDPLGWLKEQWQKEPTKKKGLERLERRRK